MSNPIECPTCRDWWWLWEGTDLPVTDLDPLRVFVMLATGLGNPIPCPDCNPDGAKKGKDHPARAGLEAAKEENKAGE
uniref:Uncharacterized protein n=1 Tax=viral metagenome TaxID=1070528 RepID=A0A6M3KLI7_9ZZZZ